jgi:hypothetical protein
MIIESTTMRPAPPGGQRGALASTHGLWNRSSRDLHAASPTGYGLVSVEGIFDKLLEFKDKAGFVLQKHRLFHGHFAGERPHGGAKL